MARPEISAPKDRDFIRVGQSRIQGRGVFAKRKIPKGTRVVEYLGDRIPLENSLRDLTPGEPASVYVVYLDETTVIDGARNGNDARFINHSCNPNCEAYGLGEHVYIYSMCEIIRGQELTFDYKLASTTGRRRIKQNAEAYRCRCGSVNCRGTMLELKSKRKRD
jgi:uncharacterized protein